MPQTPIDILQAQARDLVLLALGLPIGWSVVVERDGQLRLLPPQKPDDERELAEQHGVEPGADDLQHAD